MIFVRGGVTNELILNILFYIIITPVLTVTMTKIMFQSENKMIVEDAFKRIDSIMNIEPLKTSEAKRLEIQALNLKM